jgi:hypothetical protein
MRHKITHLHLAGQGEHIVAFLVDDDYLVLGESTGDLLKRQAVFTNSMKCCSNCACSPSTGPLA